MDQLGSFINPLAERAGTALNEPPIGGELNIHWGHLITDNTNHLADSSGNRLIYST